jgi:hypothetical protein
MAKRQFSKVSPAIWASRRFRSVSVPARTFLIYLMTNEHIDSSGCYRLPLAYAAHDFDVEPDQVGELLGELVKADLISRDEEADWVFIKRWFKHNPPINDSHATGTRKIISQIESDPLREETETAFNEAVEAIEAQMAAKAARKAEAAGRSGGMHAENRFDRSSSAGFSNSAYGRQSG